MLNPPLLFVSAVFFLGANAIFYVVIWLCVTALLRCLRLSARISKLLLFAALVLPPITAFVFTTGGAFFRHVHSTSRQHHSAMCGDVFHFLMTSPGQLPSAAGIAVNGVAWLLVIVGVVYAVKLFGTTAHLVHEITPHLEHPSAKLEAATARLGSFGKMDSTPFFEAAIPMTSSCLFGFRHVRCILSKELVVSATDEELDAIVVHETNHVRMGDVWLTFVVSALSNLFFFLRPVHLLARQWREAVELACDTETVATTQNPLALASAILRAQGVSTLGYSFPATTLGFAEETACSTEKRVERLLSLAQQTSHPIKIAHSGFWQWMATMVFAVSGVLSLLSPQAMCAAHCSLEAIARALK